MHHSDRPCADDNDCIPRPDMTLADAIIDTGKRFCNRRFCIRYMICQRNDISASHCCRRYLYIFCKSTIKADPQCPVVPTHMTVSADTVITKSTPHIRRHCHPHAFFIKRHAFSDFFYDTGHLMTDHKWMLRINAIRAIVIHPYIGAADSGTFYFYQNFFF